MMRISRKRAIIVIAGIVTLFIFWRIRTATTTNDRIVTATVSQKELKETVSSSGKTKAKKEVQLHFQTGGKLTWVGVQEGDTVNAFQTIATIDSRELEKNLTKSLRDYSKTRNDFEEDRLVTYKDKVLTDTIKRILEKNQWDLDKAVLDVEIRSIAIEWSRLVSPIRGKVVRVDTPVAGVNVTATDTFTIVDPGSIIFSASVDEIDIGQITEGSHATISLDAYPQETFLGKVTHIAFAAETSSGGATVFPVEMSFETSKNIRSGLNGDVAITVKEIGNTLTIPNDAVQIAPDQTRFAVRKSGRNYEKVTVTLGVVTENETQILQGLSEGDQVIVEGFQFLPKELLNGQAT